MRLTSVPNLHIPGKDSDGRDKEWCKVKVSNSEVVLSFLLGKSRRNVTFRLPILAVPKDLFVPFCIQIAKK